MKHADANALGSTRRSRIGVIAIATMIFTFWAAPVSARSRPSVRKAKQACLTAYQQARQAADAGHLLKSKDISAQCLQPSCGTFIQQQCALLRAQVESDVPSVVPVVTDDAGRMQVLVEVRMDGALLTSKLDGLALSIDPGRHEFSFSTDNGIFATQRLFIVQGERNRALPVKLRLPRKRRILFSDPAIGVRAEEVGPHNG
jgi:hypothetical protein